MKPISTQALSSVMIRKFVEMGLLNEKKVEGKTLFFLTEQGRIILANFGIEEKELYPFSK